MDGGSYLHTLTHTTVYTNSGFWQQGRTPGCPADGCAVCSLRATCSLLPAEPVALPLPAALRCTPLHPAVTRCSPLNQWPRRAFGLVQVGALVADAIMRRSSETLLCVCYTNHALDQFLEALLSKGITSIVRIGSRSKSQQLEQYNLFNLTGGGGASTQRTRLPTNEFRRVMSLRQEEDKFKGQVGSESAVLALVLL